MRLSAALLALLVAGPVAGQGLSRADPALRYLLMTRAAAPTAPRQPLADRVAVAPPGVAAALERLPGLLRVRTLVRVGSGGEAALRQAGADIGVRVGDIVTARIPLDAVPGLLAEPGIRAMEAAMPLQARALPPAARRADRPSAGAAMPPANDSADADAGFDELRRRVGSSWEGLAGDGVIIGIVDSGLDLTHDDFLDPSGATRVLFAWDQTDSTGAPPGAVGGSVFTGGTECTSTSIDAGECPMVDSYGHGTHVAGTAAGDGSATGRDQPAWRFPGGAPNADLIVVRGSRANVFSADLVLEAVAYIFARADALHRPAVVNLSMSAWNGPHDGSSLLEQALNELSGPGRIVVSGAGNFGDNRNTTPLFTNGPLHAQGAGTGHHGVRLPSYSPRPGAGNDGVLLEMWYDGADSLRVTVTSPGGGSLTVATGDSASLQTLEGGIAIMNALDGPSPLNGDHSAIIAIGDALETVPPDTGRWQIDVTAQALHAGGTYHVWVIGWTLDTSDLVVLEGGTTNRYLVTAPSTADRVISVGAHVTRHQWTGVGGELQSYEWREPMGDIAFFSSPGPRRDGVQKPDITAPGKVLISSLSKDATLWDTRPGFIEADSVHAGLLGTSMSAPQASGAVALMLQADPELTPEEVRDALRLSAATDALVARPVPNAVWGAGKLDVAAAVERIRPDGLAGPGQPVNLSANPVRGDALVINYSARPRSVAIYTLVAERVRTFSDQELGPLSVVWPLDTDAGGDVANGVYVLVVELPDRRVVKKLFVARP